MSGRSPLWFAVYLDERQRLFGEGACCSRCGTTDVVVLLRSRSRLCRRCDLFRRTGRTTELHHLGGRPSASSLEVDANMHAWLTLLQNSWRGRLVPGSSEAWRADLFAFFVVSVCRRYIGGAAA